MLKNVHADYVKFDKAFIAGSDSDERRRMVLEASMKLCHDLGLSVVAEGVETETQFEYLKSLGCELFQGYFLSHPLPISEFEKKY